MSKLYRALNVANEKEMIDLVESLELSDSQYVDFMTALNSDMSEDGYRLVLENLTKSWMNGSYEKLQEQFSKKKPERKLKKVEDWDIYYGDKYLGHHKLERDLKTGKGKTISVTDKDGKEEKIDEDTVYDHSWYEVKGQKYPKRTKEGVIVKESVEDLSNVRVGEILLDNEGRPYIVTEVDTTYGEDKYGNPANYITLAHYDGGKAKGSLGMPSTGLKYIFHKENESMGDELNESVDAINPKVLDELYDIISDQMGDMYMANYDEIDFDNLLDSVEDFGNDIDGYNPALKKDYALALKTKWELKHPEPLKEAKDVEDGFDTAEKPVEEEKPVSTADPEIAKFIDQTEKIIDTTTNDEILQSLAASIESKIPLTVDVEQMNKLGELKQKADTKIAAVKKSVAVRESIDPNDVEEKDIFFIGDKVKFVWDNENLSGTVKNVQRYAGARYYTISVSKKDGGETKIHNYTFVDPVCNEMRMDYGVEELDEMCSGSVTASPSVASIVKPTGKIAKRKNKRKTPDAIDTKLFKESILTNTPCTSDLEGHHFEYFMNEGLWYLSCDNALVKTFRKDVMLESIDEILNGEEPSCGLLEGYSCYEMNILMEDITATTTTGDDTNDELTAAIMTSAQQSNNGNLNNINKSDIENKANDPEIIKQNKDSAVNLKLKVGQKVNTVNDETSEQIESELTGVDEDKGLAFLKDTEGQVTAEPASKVQLKA